MRWLALAARCIDDLATGLREGDRRRVRIAAARLKDLADEAVELSYRDAESHP